MVNIRLAAISDSGQINSLSVHLGYEQVSDSKAQERLGELLNSENDSVYVAEDNAGLVGWFHCFKALRLASDSFFEIGGMVVNPSNRRRGFGKKMVRYALSENPGNWRVRCNSKRDEAHQFYELIGFTNSKTQYVFENRL
jgi:GNAT superfamily N-acetyltransferase